MRTNHAAIAALDADIGLPDRHEVGDIALFPLGSGAGIGAIHRQGADRQFVAAPGHHHRRHVAHELRRVGGHSRRQFDGAGRPRRHRHLAQIGQGVVHRLEVLAHHLFALAHIALFDRILDLFNRFIARQYARNGEETSLHDGVDSGAHAVVAGYLLGIDAVDPQLLGDNFLLHRPRDPVPAFLRLVRAGVQQQHGAGGGMFEDIAPVEEVELMTADEVGRLHQIRRANRVRSEAQVRDRLRAGFLGVVDEIALGVKLGIVADDLD